MVPGRMNIIITGLSSGGRLYAWRAWTLKIPAVQPCPSGPPSRVFLLRAGQKRGFPRPGLCIKGGRRGRAYFFPRKPLQRSAVSKLLPTGPSSAWRLNSALRASNNAARACGSTSPAEMARNSTIFSQICGEKRTASRRILPGKLYAQAAERGRAVLWPVMHRYV